MGLNSVSVGRRVMDGLAALTVLALLTPPACRKQALYLSELGREA